MSKVFVCNFRSALSNSGLKIYVLLDLQVCKCFLKQSYDFEMSCIWRKWVWHLCCKHHTTDGCQGDIPNPMYYRFPWWTQQIFLFHLTKWPIFSRWHFWMHFIELKCLNFEYNLTEICSQGSNWQWYSTGSDNGLVLNIPQAIIWTSDGLGWWHINASLGLNELKVLHWHWVPSKDEKP